MTSVIDPRDHENIIEATFPVEPLAKVLAIAMEFSETTLIGLVQARKAWEKTAGLMTPDETVKAQSTEEQYRSYEKLLPCPTALAQRRIAAKEVLCKEINFDWELPRTQEAQYMYQWTVKGIIERCLACAPLGYVQRLCSFFTLSESRAREKFLRAAGSGALNGAITFHDGIRYPMLIYWTAI
jgi:isocitrate lyase